MDELGKCSSCFFDDILLSLEFSGEQFLAFLVLGQKKFWKIKIVFQSICLLVTIHYQKHAALL